MNLRQLSTEAMINVSGFWLSSSAVRAILDSHPLSAAMAQQLEVAHDMLSALEQRRLANVAASARLTGEIAELDERHDRMVRALIHYLGGLIEMTENDDVRAWLSDLRARLFPMGLALVNSAYTDEAGWARSVASSLEPGERARMATIRIGSHTLDDVCEAWLLSGIALGERLLERAQLQAANASTGPEADSLHVRRVRSTWIRTVRALLNSLDLGAMNEAERLQVLAPLAKSVELAERDADADADAGAGEGEGDGDGDIGDEPDREPEPAPAPEPEVGPQPDVSGERAAASGTAGM